MYTGACGRATTTPHPGLGLAAGMRRRFSRVRRKGVTLAPNGDGGSTAPPSRRLQPQPVLRTDIALGRPVVTHDEAGHGAAWKLFVDYAARRSDTFLTRRLARLHACQPVRVAQHWCVELHLRPEANGHAVNARLEIGSQHTRRSPFSAAAKMVDFRQSEVRAQSPSCFYEPASIAPMQRWRPLRHGDRPARHRSARKGQGRSRRAGRDAWIIAKLRKPPIFSLPG